MVLKKIDIFFLKSKVSYDLNIKIFDFVNFSKIWQTLAKCLRNFCKWQIFNLNYSCVPLCELCNNVCDLEERLQRGMSRDFPRWLHLQKHFGIFLTCETGNCVQISVNLTSSLAENSELFRTCRNSIQYWINTIIQPLISAVIEAAENLTCSTLYSEIWGY